MALIWGKSETLAGELLIAKIDDLRQGDKMNYKDFCQSNKSVFQEQRPQNFGNTFLVSSPISLRITSIVHLIYP